MIKVLPVWSRNFLYDCSKVWQLSRERSQPALYVCVINEAWWRCMMSSHDDVGGRIRKISQKMTCTIAAPCMRCMPSHHGATLLHILPGLAPFFHIHTASFMSLRTADIRSLNQDKLTRIVSDDFDTELQHLRRATPSAESVGLAPGDTHDSPSYRLYGADAAEVNRTMLSIFALRWILTGDYKSFTQAQQESTKLSWESFQRMSTFFNQCLPTLNDVYLLVIATIVADIGKDPSLAGEIQQHSGRKVAGNHDYLVYEAAKLDLIPCLAIGKLDDADREDILLGLEFAAKFNIPQLAQAENVPGSLRAVAAFKSRSRAIQLKVLEVFLDVAGAAAQKSLKGSLTMTEDVYHTYMITIKALTEFIHDHDITETQCYYKVLQAKSSALTEKGFGIALNTKNPSDRALLRLLCMGRVSTVEIAQYFQSAFDELSDCREALISHLNATGLTKDNPATIPYYGPALFARVLSIWHDQAEHADDGIKWLISALAHVMHFLSRVCKPGSRESGISNIALVQERNLDFALQALAAPGDSADILGRLASLAGSFEVQ
jgi:hypothetical protein